MKRLRVLAVVLALAMVAAALASAAASPKAELTVMRRAVHAKHSVRYVALNTQPHYVVRMVCDAGRGIGIQRVTITHDGHTGAAEVRVVNKIAFIKGNAFGMQHFFGFQPSQAKKYANTWIFITQSAPVYASIASGVTYASLVGSIFPSSDLALVHEGTLIGVRGTTHDQAVTMKQTISAPADGKPLPVKVVATSPVHAGHNRTTMSRWNEPVHVAVPKHAVSIEVIGG